MKNGNRILLILDLDETLIHAAEQPLRWQADFALGPFHVYCRPGLNEFLVSCSEHYDIAVWSSAGADYVEALLDRIMPNGITPQFVWARERCTRRFDHEHCEEYYLKDLKKVKRKGYDLAKTLIIEDSPEKVERHYGNAIYVSPFLGSPDDIELRLLSDYLLSLHATDDVRRIEKRNWRSRQTRR